MSSSSSSKKSLKIGIIGFGPFAQFLVKTMIKQGHSITATSRSDYTDICSHLGISFFRYLTFIDTYVYYLCNEINANEWNRDTNEFLESKNEVIVVCTSILSLSQVMKSLPFNCLKHPTLFVDVLSVKEYPRDVMLQVCNFSSFSSCSSSSSS